MTVNEELPSGQAAYSVIPTTVPAPTFYAIQPTDTLAVNVFGEAELSQSKIRVDDAGYVQMPLIGQVKVGGLSAPEASQDIAQKYAASYLKSPQVVVSVSETTPRYVTLEGEVSRPGSYEITSRATLLSSVALAESPTNTAKLDEVIVFRTIEGQRMAARFDLKEIRGGVSPDPVILDGDIIVIGHSGGRQFWQDFLKMAPILNVFSLIATR